MKRAIRYCLVIIGSFLLISILTCPDDDDYRKWLSEKHSISCSYNGFETICKKENGIVEWKSKHIRSAGIYMQVKDIYADSKTIYKIKALGIFGIFIDLS